MWLSNNVTSKCEASGIWSSQQDGGCKIQWKQTIMNASSGWAQWMVDVFLIVSRAASGGETLCDNVHIHIQLLAKVCGKKRWMLIKLVCLPPVRSDSHPRRSFYGTWKHRPPAHQPRSFTQHQQCGEFRGLFVTVPLCVRFGGITQKQVHFAELVAAHHKIYVFGLRKKKAFYTGAFAPRGSASFLYLWLFRFLNDSDRHSAILPNVCVVGRGGREAPVQTAGE